MVDISKAFEVNEGILVNLENAGTFSEGPFLTGGTISPVGLNLPEKTLYLQNAPSGIIIWRKFSNGVNDWRQLSAEDIPFDGTEETDGTPVVPVFVSDNTRDGIIEARNTATGLARFVVSLTYNGNIGNGTFIGYLNTIPGDSTPVIFPFDCTIDEFTFSNLRTNADYTLEFRKNTTVGTPFYTVSKVNTQFFSDNGINENFSSGDQIYVKYVDDGNNASDVVVSLFLKRATP